jgi:hypothetical protein
VQRAATLVLLALGIAASALPGAAAAATITANGDASWESFGYPNPDTGGQRWENFLAATLRARGDLLAGVTYRLDLRAVADDVEFTAGVLDVRNSRFRRPYLAAKEMLVSYRLLPELRLSAGKQLVLWSLMEGLKPANLMVPKDESDPFRQWEEGVWSLGLHYEDERGLSGEAFVVPIAFTPSRVPQGRWQIIPEDIAQTQDLPPVQLDETQVGVRVRAQVEEWESAILFYAGRSTEAIFVPELIFVGGDEVFRVEIVDRYPHLYAPGVQLSRPIGEDVVWRFELVYYHSPDPDQDDFIHTTSGAEYVVSDWRFGLNYFRDDTTARAPEEVTNEGALRFFRSFLSGAVRYDPGWWRFTVQAGHDFTEEFSLVQPSISAEVYRNLRLTLEGDVITASRPSYFDSIRHDDRIGAKLEYFF